MTDDDGRRRTKAICQAGRRSPAGRRDEAATLLGARWRAAPMTPMRIEFGTVVSVPGFLPVVEGASQMRADCSFPARFRCGRPQSQQRGEACAHPSARPLSSSAVGVSAWALLGVAACCCLASCVSLRPSLRRRRGWCPAPGRVRGCLRAGPRPGAPRLPLAAPACRRSSSVWCGGVCGCALRGGGWGWRAVVGGVVWCVLWLLWWCGLGCGWRVARCGVVAGFAVVLGVWCLGAPGRFWFVVVVVLLWFRYGRPPSLLCLGLSLSCELHLSNFRSCRAAARTITKVFTDRKNRPILCD